VTSEFAKLLEILVKQRDVFLKLRQIMESAETALRRYDASSVDEHNKTTEIIKLRMSALEQARRNLTERLAKNLGLSEEASTISNLATRAPGRFGPALIDMKRQLNKLAESVAAQNRKNHILARASLEIVHDLGRLLGQVAGGSATYKPFNTPEDAKPFAGVISRRL